MNGTAWTEPGQGGYLQTLCALCRERKGVNEGMFYGPRSRFICNYCISRFCVCDSLPTADDVQRIAEAG